MVEKSDNLEKIGHLRLLSAQVMFGRLFKSRIGYPVRRKIYFIGKNFLQSFLYNCQSYKEIDSDAFNTRLEFITLI